MKNQRFKLSTLHKKAERRPAGYFEDFMSIGHVEGEFLIVDDMPKYFELCRKYGTGIGTAIAKVAQPIARAIDKISGGKTDLKNCIPCKKKEAKLNGI